MKQETEFQTAGLSNNEAEARLREHGKNEVETKVRYSAATEFLLEFKNPLVFILIFAACVSAFVGDWTSSIIILVIVVSSTVLDFVNTYKSQKAAELLKQQVQVMSRVFRGGLLEQVPLAFIVPGDSIYLSAGDVVPADGKLLQVKNQSL